MGREFEKKFKAPEEQFAAILADFTDLAETKMETTYYDSPFRRLGALHWTLRRRMENGISVCTLKTPTADGARNEWEVQCSSIMQAIPMLCKLGAPMELMSATVSGIIPVCGAKFTRLSREITFEDCTLELALDRGVLTGGGKEIPLLALWVNMYTSKETGKVVYDILPLDDQIEDWKTQFALTDSTLKQAEDSLARTMKIVGSGLEKVNEYLANLPPVK